MNHIGVALSIIFGWRLASEYPFTDSLYLVQVKTGYSYDAANNMDISYFPFSIVGLGKQRKIPSRVILENSIWENYYSSFVNSSAMRGSDRYVNIAFSVKPEWTEKGLSMRVYAWDDSPSTNWLITDKKDELAKYYPAYELKLVMKPGMHYCIDLQLHEAPVHDFIEASARAKYNYALEIHKQELDLVGRLKEILQSYVPAVK